MQKSLLALAGWLLLTFSAAGIGAVASMNAADFYVQLARLGWAPPSWLFGPVWSVLYLAMAVAAWLVWQERESRNVRAALVLYVVQLALNALWSWLFFAWHFGAAAFVEILLLWPFIVATLIAFWRVRRLAGLLLLPYLLWVTFAAALNFSVWQLNPQVL